MKMTDNTQLSPSHERQQSLQSEEPFLHTIIGMSQCIIMRFFMLLVITAALKQVLSSAFKIMTPLLSESGRFVLVILNAMRRRGSTTGSIEETAYS